MADPWIPIPVSEFEALHARIAESEAENDQWQKKLAEVWAEVKWLRDELRTTQETLTACLEVGLEQHGDRKATDQQAGLEVDGPQGDEDHIED